MLKGNIPHTWVIIFSLIILSAIMTWIIPGGEYKKVIIDGKEILKYEKVENIPQTWQIFSAFYKGFTKHSGIVIFILIIGGAFWIINSSKAIDLGISKFLDLCCRLEKNRLVNKIGIDNLILISVMTVFSVFGAVFGMSEETIAFIIIMIPLAIKMGYDSIIGVCMVYLAAHVGFAGATLNPFTIGIAQGIAGLPLFSGLEYRILCFFILTLVSIGFVLNYAKKIKKNPQLSPVYELDEFWRQRKETTKVDIIAYKKTKASWISFFLIQSVILILAVLYPMTKLSFGSGEHIDDTNIILPVFPLLSFFFALLSIITLRKTYHYFILNLLFFSIIFLVIGVLAYQWYIPEISALFLGLGIISGIAMGKTGNEIVKLFIEGAKDILSAALVVGLAGGIIVILEEGKIVATILYKLSSFVEGMGEIATAGAIYLITTIINIIIPSGSAKAALIMPVMTPLSEIVGLSKQVTVLAFQFGDGITNMITPTSGVLIGVLGIAKIPYDKWFKWVLPFILVLFVLGFLLLIPPILINMPGY